MADFKIISSQDGSVLYEGAPKYVGAYMRPAYLEFLEIGSPEPIGWSVGDYIVYSRLGMTFKLYSTPRVTKKASANKYGGSFVYENVQFFSGAKMLDICPFSDTVPGDNRIHFSTVDTFSFVGTPSDLADRVRACLADMYPGEWIVRIENGLPPELTEEKEFSASGLTVLGALDRGYDLWPGLGWTHTVENGVNVLTIGGSNVRTVANTTNPFSYDAGLTRLGRSVGNADELTTRLYGYGSMRNMPAGYYKGKAIKDAESADIEHLMIPISEWGLTGNLPDPSKAYVENAAAIAKYGLIPRKVYFDGSDSRYPEIYPSLQGITAGQIREIKTRLHDSENVPSSSWADSDRVDELVSASVISDDGTQAEDGKKYIESSDVSVSVNAELIPTRDTVGIEPIVTLFTYLPVHNRDCTLLVDRSLSGTISLLSGNHAPGVHAYLCFSDPAGKVIWDSADASVPVSITEASQGVWRFTVPRIYAKYEAVNTVWLVLGVRQGDLLSYGTEGSHHYGVALSGSATVNIERELDETFQVTIPQIGFDIEGQAAIGGGMVMSMKSGMCAGRDFKIESCVYNDASDTWTLTLWRASDDNLGSLFPNSDFPLAAHDRFVLLDIAMPELYILAQSERLLDEVQELLDDACEEKPFYEPEVDSAYVYNNSWFLREGMYMHLVNDEVVEGGEDYAIIDSLEIDEAQSNIPVYSLKLRMRKATGWSTASGTTAGKNSVSADSKAIREMLYAESRRLAIRSFRNAMETAAMLVDAKLEGFTESISPITVQTMQLIAGSESLQFRFIVSATDDTVAPDPVSYNKNTKVLSIAHSFIQHMTLGIDEITSSGGRSLSDYKIWEMSELSPAPTLVDGSKKYYIYARVSKTGTTGNYVVSEQSIAMEQETGYYHLLVGLLNSEMDGDRDYVPMYGFTEILPGQITTDFIRSADGNSFLDLAHNQAKLGNALRALSWNLNNDGELRVSGGTIVQSSGGETFMITCFRGLYAQNEPYYYGDEVYTEDGATYVYINKTTSSTGRAPSNDGVYWRLKQAAGSSAKLVTLTASSLFFTYEDANAQAPTGDTSITLTCLTQNISSPTFKWYYYGTSGWVQISGETTSTLLVGYSHAAFQGGKVAKIKVVVSNTETLYDEVSIYKVYGGDDSISAFLTNPSHLFAAGISAAVQATDTFQVLVFRGATQLPYGNNGYTIGSITGQIAGAITANVDSSGQITVSVTTSLVQQSGTLVIPVIIGSTTINLKYSWALSLTGAKGSKGAKLRGPTYWEIGKYYENGETTDIQDIVTASNGNQYVCLIPHTSTSLTNPINNPVDPVSGDPLWGSFNKMEYVATKVILSERGTIENLVVEELYTKKVVSGNTIYPISIQGNSITIKDDDGEDKVKITSETLPTATTSGANYALSGGNVNLSYANDAMSGLDTVITLRSGITISRGNNKLTIPPIVISVTPGANTGYYLSCNLFIGSRAVDNILIPGTIPQNIITLAPGTYDLYLKFYGSIWPTSGDTASAVINVGFGSQQSPQANLIYTMEFTEIAVDGCQFRYGTEGFKTTESNGAKVIQGGNEYNMLGGGTLNPTGANAIPAPKRIVVCSEYPSAASMEADVLYIKVAPSSS